MIAIVSAIAMVVCSVTVYNTSSVNASGSATVDGIIYTVTDGDTDIVGFTCQGIFDSARIHFAWGTALDADTITATVNGEDVAVDGKNANGMFIPLSEVSDLGEGEYSIVVTGTSQEDPKKTLTGNATLKIESQGETTTRDPSEITEWTPVTGSSNIYYNIYDNEAKVSVKPQIEMIDGKNTVYTALSLAATFSRVVINGVDVAEEDMPDGAFIRLFVEKLTEEYYTVVVYDHYGTESVTILLKVEEEPETTTAAPVPDDTEILLNTQFIGADNWNHDNMISSTDNGDGSMSCVVEEKAGGETYSTQLVQNGITLEEGKWYVAKYTVSSDVDKNFRLLIQSDGNAGGDWSEFGGLVTSVKAGQEVEVTLKFQASKAANGNALYGILMGYIDATASAEANVTVKAVSLKEYSTEPEVETGSVVVKEPEQEDYKVTVDNE